MKQALTDPETDKHPLLGEHAFPPTGLFLSDSLAMFVLEKEGEPSLGHH